MPPSFTRLLYSLALALAPLAATAEIDVERIELPHVANEPGTVFSKYFLYEGWPKILIFRSESKGYPVFYIYYKNEKIWERRYDIPDYPDCRYISWEKRLIFLEEPIAPCDSEARSTIAPFALDFSEFSHDIPYTPNQSVPLISLSEEEQNEYDALYVEGGYLNLVRSMAVGGDYVFSAKRRKNTDLPIIDIEYTIPYSQDLGKFNLEGSSLDGFNSAGRKILYYDRCTNPDAVTIFDLISDEQYTRSLKNSYSTELLYTTLQVSEGSLFSLFGSQEGKSVLLTPPDLTVQSLDDVITNYHDDIYFLARDQSNQLSLYRTPYDAGERRPIGVAEDKGEGWFRSSWLGFYYGGHTGWVWHYGMGWIYVWTDSEPWEFYFYTLNGGWCYTRNEWFEGGLWFYDYTSGEWKQATQP